MNSSKGPCWDDQHHWWKVTAVKSQGYWREIVASRRREDGAKERRNSRTVSVNIGRKGSDAANGATRNGVTRANASAGMHSSCRCLSRPKPRRARTLPNAHDIPGHCFKIQNDHHAHTMRTSGHLKIRMRDLTYFRAHNLHAAFAGPNWTASRSFAGMISCVGTLRLPRRTMSAVTRYRIGYEAKKEARQLSIARAGMRSAGKLDSIIALDDGYEFIDVDVIRRNERQGKPPLRGRQKPGPKPTYNGRSGSSTERSRRRRARLRAAAS
jgi:hypothetical protein